MASSSTANSPAGGEGQQNKKKKRAFVSWSSESVSSHSYTRVENYRKSEERERVKVREYRGPSRETTRIRLAGRPVEREIVKERERVGDDGEVVRERRVRRGSDFDSEEQKSEEEGKKEEEQGQRKSKWNAGLEGRYDISEL
ncbi:hypothetical protein M011DRAFT_476031 [Sporormia fimetaria CBS 119925]|uniref:Uncharacterized protein n=1 Tax=Sporormia fimetaria CBS 119925 TaxID=1340428 RepID=A0A6A6VEI5_9PLEO|nr:hypothetical protein M011DRAFT_476031 [Sporormia fimetaria CBS 119925]